MKTKSKAIVKRKQRKQGKVKVSRKKKGSRKRQKGGLNPLTVNKTNADLELEKSILNPGGLLSLARSRKAREDAGQKTITKTVTLKHTGQGEKKNWGLHFKPVDINGMVLRSNDIDSIDDVSYETLDKLGADDRIIEVNGESLSNFNKDEIKLLIIEASKGTTVEFKVIPRKFQPITVTLTYKGENPENSKKDWGLEVDVSVSDNNTDNKGIIFQQIKDKTNVKITGELHPGYRIIEINEKSLLNSPPETFVMELLKEAQKGETIKLKVLPAEFQSSPSNQTGNSQSSI
jgi:hypothetical protein